MIRALLKYIPSCLYEPLALLALIGGILLAIAHWKKDRAETLLFVFSCFFMIFWRVLMPINSDRYTLAVVPIAILIYLSLVEKIAEKLHWKYFIPVILMLSLLTLTIRVFHRNSDEVNMYTLINTVKQESGKIAADKKILTNWHIACFFDTSYRFTVIQLDQQCGGGTFRPESFPGYDYILLRIPRHMIEKAPSSKYTLLLRINGKSASDYLLWKKKDEPK